MFYSLPPVARRRSVRHSVSVPRLPDQWSFNSQVGISKSTTEADTQAVQINQGSMSGMEDMVRQLQESMKAMQEDAVREAEFAK